VQHADQQTCLLTYIASKRPNPDRQSENRLIHFKVTIVHPKQGEQLSAETVSLARQTNSKAMDGLQRWLGKVEQLSLCLFVCVSCCFTDAEASFPAQVRRCNTEQVVSSCFCRLSASSTSPASCFKPTYVEAWLGAVSTDQTAAGLGQVLLLLSSRPPPPSLLQHRWASNMTNSQ
jgi:hypothetical protein